VVYSRTLEAVSGARTRIEREFDECHLFVVPVAVGAGKCALPENTRLELELVDERRFAGGVVHLPYRVRT
jgi:dihydrofolate reductase